MASVALDLRVRESKWKFRLIVIEVDGDPFVLIVASLAFRTVSTGVDILNSVAFDARCAEILVAFAEVACGADDNPMGPQKRELCLAVVERLDAPPSVLVMTILALLPEAPFVRIARLMTIEAASGGVAELDRWQVTTTTLHRFVCAFEFEIRHCVIECFSIKLDDVGSSPLVIGMAMVAFL